MVNNLNAEALRNALVVASMEYCKKYLEGQNVDKTIEEVSISSEMIPFPTDTVVLEAGKFTVESREYDILDGTCTVILDQQITWTEHPQEYNDAMLAYKKRWNNTIDLSCEDFFKMKQLVQRDAKLQAIKHVKESTKCGLREAKDFVDTYCDYVLND